MFCQELAKQLARDVLPDLLKANVKLVAVGIGTGERAKEFAAHVGFPEEYLYADPENACYSALGLKKNIKDTFFNINTPYSILARGQKDGAKDLVEAVQRWKPWIPPKLDQGFQQGGAFVFDGSKELFQHYDPSTGAHADLNAVLSAAIQTA
uniref:Uncharacterized protein n=1 Tax=Lotharella oceanica TaxID=641309 RepID=A0A7S2TNB7_9EUKA|mmetsp:Transcript_20479/g.38510  ORF Transcript_20479/g.38510 Transcript_20479/m.38510 type:complete len:152 (+) Transcript_20479:412-867(+)